MPPPVEFRNVSFSGSFEGLTFESTAGGSLVIVTGREDESELLLRLMTGLSSPTSGEVLIGGAALREMSPTQLRQARQSLGIIPAGGGLVSNLKLWENIMLPVLYQQGHVPPSLEQEAAVLLQRFGYSGNVMALPARLSLFEKRMAAFIRAVLNKPPVLVYSHLLDGITPQYRAILSAVTTEFHASQPGTAAIYLSTSTQPPTGVTWDAVITLH